MKRKKTRPKWKAWAVLEALTHVAWPILRKFFSADCCIAATRIGVEVLAKFAIEAEPYALIVDVMNAPMAEWMAAGGQGAPPADARVVSIDYLTESLKGYPGHMVLTGQADGEWFLLDLTVQQFERVEKGIHIPEAFLASLPEFPPNESMWSLPDGGAILYRTHPDPAKAAAFEKSPDWVVPAQSWDTFALVCNEIYLAVVEEIKKQGDT